MLKRSTSIVAAALLLLGALRALAEQPAAPKFEIQRATYEPLQGEGGADVTELVRGMVRGGVLSVTASNQVLGGDPTPGVRKRLRVEYTLGGRALVAMVEENGTLEIPALTPKQQAAKALALLQSDATREQKAAACLQLATGGDRDAIPVLAGLLCDGELSHMARYALEPLPDPAVDAAFREGLAQCKGRPLVGIINSVGVRRDAQAVGALVGLLKSTDAEVASAAAVTLGKIGNVAAAAALEQALGSAPEAVRPAVCDGCLRCAEVLAANDERDRAVALYDRLRGAGHPNGIRVAATRGAILARQAQGVPLLVEQLRSEELRMFHVALRLALELPGTDATKALAAELPKLPVAKQPSLMQALAKRGDKAALPALLAAAKGEQKAVRVAGLKALPPFADPSIVPTLVAAVGDADADVAKAARAGLSSVAGKEADEAIMALVENPRADLRLVAVDMLAQRQAAAAVPTLLKAATDADQAVRVAACGRLRDLAPGTEVPAVLRLLLDAKSQQDIEAAEEALTSVCLKVDPVEASAGRLIAPLATTQPATKSALLRVLAAVGGAEALKAVRAALDEGDAEVRTTALGTLCEWRTLDAAPALLDLARTAPDATEKQLCLRGYLRLARSQEEPADRRLAMCQQALPLIQDNGGKKLLLGALGTIPTAGALAMATPHLNNAAVAEEASAAVVAIAEKLIKGANTADLIAPLQKAADGTTNSDLEARARGLLLQLGQAQPLFNGKDLTGWEGARGFWSVQNGLLTGRTTAKRPTAGNTFLIWRGGEVSDFELTYKAKLTTRQDQQPFGNSGVQFRSKVLDRKKFIVGGYQADLATNVGYCGMLYEERGRGILAKPGAKIQIKDKIEPTGTLGKPDEILAGLKPTEWNEYRIVAKGSLLQLFVNGKQTVEVDDQSKAAAKSGVLALQLHAGPPMTVQFREVVLKVLQ